MLSARSDEYHPALCYPLSIRILTIIYGQDVDDMVFLINNIEEPEFADTVSPSIGIVPLEFLDVISPKGLLLDLGVNKRIEFLSQETSVARRQLLDRFRELGGFENTEIRQNGLVSLSHHEVRS